MSDELRRTTRYAEKITPRDQDKPSAMSRYREAVLRGLIIDGRGRSR